MTISFVFAVLISVFLFLSLLVNGILYFYSRRVFFRIYIASEEVSKILTMIDSYENHLKNVYELPSFYGDETLSSLLEHTKDMSKFLKQYDEVYSFTQPDLLEQLNVAEEEPEEQNDNQEETP
jgi:hypothetical protein|tara:strand:+ start:610 stop:978 length:369 start_codon:yes stop_codon:yes gene_type:complete